MPSAPRTQVSMMKQARPAVASRPAAATVAAAAAAPSANRIVLYVVLTFFAFLVLYVVYELGRYNGSYDHLAVSQERSEYEAQIERLEAANRQLRTQLAELDTIKVGHQREQAEVARTIGDLQAQVARESQELAFYRGVMAKAPIELGVRLGEVRVTRSKRPGSFIVHVSLLRSGRPDNTVSGTLTLHVDSDAGTVMDLQQLTGGKLKDLPFDFRYYKTIDQEVILPDGFKPQHLGIDLRSSQRDAPPLTQTMVWNVVP
jgi:hypothetical protein